VFVTIFVTLSNVGFRFSLLSRSFETPSVAIVAHVAQTIGARRCAIAAGIKSGALLRKKPIDEGGGTGFDPDDLRSRAFADVPKDGERIFSNCTDLVLVSRLISLPFRLLFVLLC
jgi:hypothetical protein